MGQRRFSRHWDVPQLRAELHETYHIDLSKDTVVNYLHRYQNLLAARQQDPLQLAQAYQGLNSLVLSIDGLQPEKGHETLYVVRELNAKRVWFAETLLSSSTAEVRPLFVRAREWAERLALPVKLWLSDKQDAFLKGVAAEFPDVPHRYCQNHFLRNLAKPTLAKDSTAKVQMRQKVRGLREIEREVLEQRREREASQRQDATQTEWNKDVASKPTPAGASVGRPEPEAAEGPVPTDSEAEDGAKQGAARAAEPAAAPPEPSSPAGQAAGGQDTAEQVVLDYCAAVRGILNDDQGGPLQPPGLRMAQALQEVRASLQSNLEAKKGGAARNSCVNSKAASTGGCKQSGQSKNNSRSTSTR
jgi:hypothetical protein